jgi:hypothetical protein
MVNFLLDPLNYAFMWRSLAAAVIVGLVCAVVGVFVVLRGMAFFGDALSHAILPGGQCQVHCGSAGEMRIERLRIVNEKTSSRKGYRAGGRLAGQPDNGLSPDPIDGGDLLAAAKKVYPTTTSIASEIESRFCVAAIPNTAWPTASRPEPEPEPDRGTTWGSF